MVQRIATKTAAVIGWLILGIAVGDLQSAAAAGNHRAASGQIVTVMFYLNGDNDLTDEVLSAVDRLETVGSSADVNLIALVDGHPDGVSRFGNQWSGTHLLHITCDDRTASISSTLLADWGEQDLGSPAVLQRFVRTAVERFPAQRYVFCAFAHGKGVIDTGDLELEPATKSLFISSDDSSRTIMSLNQFGQALKHGLNGRRFSSMVLFSCLSAMAEIAYELANVTDYLIASEDEIRLVNRPPGSHQLRGIDLADLPRYLTADPLLPDTELGASIIDNFIAPYSQAVPAANAAGGVSRARYAAGLALIDCRASVRLAAALNDLAARLIERLHRPDTVVPTLAAIGVALNRAQSFKSFLNLEYYDLLNWLEAMARATTDADIRTACRRSAQILVSEVIRYERHTADVESNGMSIYFSHPLVPENVDGVHRAMYARTRFGRDTRWDELIAAYRTQRRQYRLELLMDQCRRALRRGDRQAVTRRVKQLIGQLQHGRREKPCRPKAFLPASLKRSNKNRRRTDRLRRPCNAHTRCF